MESQKNENCESLGKSEYLLSKYTYAPSILVVVVGRWREH